MTDQEAGALATLAVDTWPITAKIHIWRDALRPMDHDTAVATYRHLRRNHLDRSLTIAEFSGEYRRRRPSPQSLEPGGCNECTDGWITVYEEHHGHEYRCAKPCRCTLGHTREKAHQAVISHPRPWENT